MLRLCNGARGKTLWVGKRGKGKGKRKDLLFPLCPLPFALGEAISLFPKIISYGTIIVYADVAELADALDLGSSSERSEGSSPFIRIFNLIAENCMS